VTTKQLTILLAEKVMGWRVAPNRFLIDGRRWLPTWRFNPMRNLSDAFHLLAAADVVEYVLRFDRKTLYRAKVRTNGASAAASGPSLPFAICVAIARAYGIRVEVRS
jgi:hypothetical protein